MREIRPAGGRTKTIRDSQIPPEEWARIIASGEVMAALKGGTVRLDGSKLPGGVPSIEITGIRFSEASLTKILQRYCAEPTASTEGIRGGSKSQAHKSAATPTIEVPKKPKKVVPPIKPGDLTASVAQTMQVTGLGRTKIDQLMRRGDLVRKKVGKRTLITVESIERLAGASIPKS